MPVQLSDVDRSACLAAGTVNIQPWRAGHDGAADRRRPQRGTAAGKGAVPSVDNAHGIIVGGLFGRAGAHVECKSLGSCWIMLGHAGSIRCWPEARYQSGRADLVSAARRSKFYE